jgi:hypothetical protein
MHEATQLWEWWQALLHPFAAVFTRPGGVRFVQWVTGMVLCWEEHTLPQIVTALDLGPRGGRAADTPVDRAGTTGTVGRLPSCRVG